MESILLVDDEDNFRARLKKAFENRGFKVFDGADYETALALVSQHRPRLAIIDLKMPGKNGLDLLREVLLLHPGLKVVVLTGYGSIATATEAVRLGAVAYLAKPADVDDILHAFAKEGELELPRGAAAFPPPSLARTEWEHINRVLEDCDGNISQAAKQLDIHRRTLQRKLQKYAPKN